MKRIVLFVVTNLAVMLVLGIAANLLGLNRFLTANGLNLGALLGFAAVMGFGGAIISLLISKPMAKWSTGAQVINDSPDADAPVDRARPCSASPTRPASGCPRSRSTRASRTPSPPARSRTRRWSPCRTGLLQTMNREEVEAVIGHEVAHVANGDMVTMTLIQGVMNTFVVFLSRVDRLLRRQGRAAQPERRPRHRLLRRRRSCSTSCSACSPRSSSPGSRASASTAPTRGAAAADGPQAADDQRAGAPGRPATRASCRRACRRWASAAGRAA